MRALAIVALLVGVVGCARSPLPMSRAPASNCAADPCAAMVCPPGDQCVWDTNCRPRCEQQPLPNFSR
jgi:hypothetical protein